MSLTPQKIAEIIEKYPKMIEKAVRIEVPRKVAILAKNHFKDNFRQSGFVNQGKKAWKSIMRENFGSRYKPLTSGVDNLIRSITTSSSLGQIVITNSLPYASIHNKGGEIKVTKKIKGLLFVSSICYRDSKDGKLPKKLSPEAQMWRCLTHSKHKTIHIPQRQIIGDSFKLNQKIK